MYTITLLTVLVVGTHGYLNNLDGRLNFKCPAQQYISYFFSVHDNGAEDRQFNLRCSAVTIPAETEACEWQGNYVNDYDKPFAFSCPNNGYIAGIDSIHDNGPEDRRFNFWCCHVPDYHMDDCINSGFVNDYDHTVDFTIPAGYTLRGVISTHRNEAEDRIFDFEYCRHVHMDDTAAAVG